MSETLRHSPPRLEDADFERLTSILREAFGWELGREARASMELRLRRRLEELSLPAFHDYVWLLTYDRRRADELAVVADLLSVRETYFFREEYQLRAFSDEILPQLAGRGRRVRVWSAGCASGEEAYTVAILGLESPATGGDGVDVFASDIAPAALAAARRGEYDAAALRQTPPGVRSRWFAEQDGRFRVDERVRERVRFARLNLTSDPNPPDRFDVIFCRNVSIYFSVAAKRALARRLFDALTPGGFLLLGHAESLLAVTSDFEVVTLRNDLVYRRPAGVDEGGQA